jgi:hypothetical protein
LPGLKISFDPAAPHGERTTIRHHANANNQTPTPDAQEHFHTYSKPSGFTSVHFKRTETHWISQPGTNARSRFSVSIPNLAGKVAAAQLIEPVKTLDQKPHYRVGGIGTFFPDGLFFSSRTATLVVEVKSSPKFLYSDFLLAGHFTAMVRPAASIRFCDF